MYTLDPELQKLIFGIDEPRPIAEIRAAVDRWPEIANDEMQSFVTYLDARTLSSGYRNWALENLQSGKRNELYESVRKVGIRVPLLIRKHGGIQNGNHRALIAVYLGKPFVPCLYVERVEANE